MTPTSSAPTGVPPWRRTWSRRWMRPASVAPPAGVVHAAPPTRGRWRPDSRLAAVQAARSSAWRRAPVGDAGRRGPLVAVHSEKEQAAPTGQRGFAPGERHPAGAGRLGPARSPSGGAAVPGGVLAPPGPAAAGRPPLPRRCRGVARPRRSWRGRRRVPSTAPAGRPTGPSTPGRGRRSGGRPAGPRPGWARSRSAGRGDPAAPLRPGCGSRLTGAMPDPPPPGRGAPASPSPPPRAPGRARRGRARWPRTWSPPTAPAAWWRPPRLGSGPGAGGGVSPPSPLAGWWGRSPPRPPRWPGWRRPPAGGGRPPGRRRAPSPAAAGPGSPRRSPTGSTAAAPAGAPATGTRSRPRCSPSSPSPVPPTQESPGSTSRRPGRPWPTAQGCTRSCPSHALPRSAVAGRAGGRRPAPDGAGLLGEWPGVCPADHPG